MALVVQPRGSVRETAAVTSSAAPFGVRHFPSRFGRARLRTSQSSRIYPPRVEGEQASSCSTSDLMASPGPAPAGRWRHFGRTRSARSYFGDDDTSPERSTYSSRASPIGSPPARTVPHPHRHTPVPAMRRSLPPLPLTNLSESKVLDKGSTTSWGQSLSPTRASVTSSSALPEYRPLDVDYEPQPVKPVPRRRQRVLGSTRRPAGNYYERLLKKRGRRQGRLGPYYDVESIEGSDLSGVLSDVDSYEGTYDNDSDYESSSVSPSTYRQLPSSVSPSSPYYVDQDTEFVPFKPSRPLLTKGLLEVTPYGNESNGNECSNSEALPSPTTDLSLSRYVPSSLVSAATSVSRPPLPRPSYRSVVPYTSPVSKSTVDLSPSPSQKLLESLVTSSVERARSAINNLAIPEYRGASLVLSVEGAGVSPDGKKVDFTYTPPPIPLYGRSLSLNDSVLGIRPASSVKPVDKFISGYMERMDALKAELNSRLDKDKERRLQYGLKPLDTGPRPSRSRTPSYTQSHEYVPVKDLTSERLEQLPVTTFRRQQDDGQTERVDVFSLGEFRPRLSSSATRAITIPESATGGYQLSVIDKINIKVTLVKGHCVTTCTCTEPCIEKARSGIVSSSCGMPIAILTDLKWSFVYFITSLLVEVLLERCTRCT